MIEFRSVASTDPLAAPLIADLAREYDERYGTGSGPPPSVELSRYPPETFMPDAGGAFMIAVEDGHPIAGGAFMRTDDTTAEVKRMWTDRAHRRRGLARMVLAELEREAAHRGYRRIQLTTGFAQPEAVALYLAEGYEPQFDPGGDLRAIGYLPFSKWLWPFSPQ